MQIQRQLGMVAFLAATLPIIACAAAPEAEGLIAEKTEFVADTVPAKKGEEKFVADTFSAKKGKEKQKKQFPFSELEKDPTLLPEGTLEFRAGHGVRRTLTLEANVQESGEPATRMAMVAKAVLTPMNATATELLLNIEALRVEMETYGDNTGLVVADTEASLTSSPLIWWRSRGMVRAIQSPIWIKVDEQGEISFDAPEDELVLATIHYLVPRCERIFAKQWLTTDDVADLTVREGEILGDAVHFAVSEIGDDEVVATYAEVGDVLGEFRGVEGMARWNREDSLLLQLNHTIDYYEKEDGIAPAAVTIFLSSERES